MAELEKRIGLLRLLLADIQGKQEQLSDMERQYRAQLSRIVDFVVYREGDVGNALSLMSEVQTKLDEVSQTLKHLAMVEGRASTELEVLMLTMRVAEARSQLAKLEERQQELSAKLSPLSGSEPERVPKASGELTPPEDLKTVYDEVESEIARLHSLITDVSERAARTIRPKTQE
jgi:chromosome segregation ATPase